MYPVVNFFKSFFASLVATIISLFTMQIMIPLFLKEVNKISSSITFYGFKAFGSWLIIFFTSFCVLGSIFFILKAIIEMIKFFYYSIFYNGNQYDKINLSVDQDNIIRESYVEFKNGQKLPIDIRKIVYNPVEEKQEEKKGE